VVQHERRRSDGSLFGGGSDVESQWGMLRLTVPLFNGGMTYSRVREARELLAKTTNESLAEERAVERRALNSLNGVMTAMSRVRALGAAVQAKERSMESWQVAYRSGAAPSLAVLEAERDLFFNRAELVRARHQYVMDTLRLKHAVGGLTPDDLESFNVLLDPAEIAVGPYVAVR
jgi:outer membrane protein